MKNKNAKLINHIQTALIIDLIIMAIFVVIMIVLFCLHLNFWGVVMLVCFLLLGINSNYLLGYLKGYFVGKVEK